MWRRHRRWERRADRGQARPLSVIEDEERAGRGGDLRRQLKVETLEQGDEIAAPSDGNRRGADSVFDDEVPANDPGEDFAQRGVAVGVGGAGDRNQGGEFGIAEPGEDAARARENE